MSKEERPSSSKIIQALCPSKKRGHRCVVSKKNKHDTHVCFCTEQWEEVKT